MRLESWPESGSGGIYLLLPLPWGRLHNGSPPPSPAKMFTSYLPESVNLALHGKRDFADVIKLRTLRGSDYPGLSGWA